ncbi:MAG: LPS assembly protein LptD [Pseudomonadota bacterium]
MRVLILVMAALAWPQMAAAQLATLVADEIGFDGRDQIVASGNVEIFYQGQRVLAERLVYNQEADVLQVAGPITVIEASGTILTASFAELSGDLRNGIIKSARLVILEQMQVAAAEAHRVEGRYNQLYKSVASSCRVCANNPTPLWQIRADRVVYDQEERQIYFDNARFEVLGVPVFWAPYLRLPDPTLRRASGFLFPSLTQKSELGLGFRFPYFVALGDHADLTITALLSANTRTLEGRYRQAFRFGRIQLEGAVSSDDILPDEYRAFLFGRGEFDLSNDFTLNVNVELVSDRGYLETYGYSDKDRLSNELEITRTKRNEYISFSLETLRTLRDNEVPIKDTLATNLIAGRYERRFPGIIGGEARLVFDMLGFEREADRVDAPLLAACAAVDPAVPAAECIARDVFRTSAELSWVRNWTLTNGVLARVETGLAADFYIVGQDATFSDNLNRLTPQGAVEMRWPLTRNTADGGRQILEPVVQLAWSETYGDDTPNEDSRLVEFDEGNLLSLSRFPGEDARETGFRGALGVSWTHFSPKGREYAVTVARILRETDAGLFSGASGLDGGSSDWLVAGRLEFNEELSLTNRSLFDNAFDFAKSETRLGYIGRKLSASTSYTWVEAALSEGRAQDLSEWSVDLGYAFDANWIGRANWRYDLVNGDAVRAGVGLGYRNECVNIDLSLSRRFTSSSNVVASTDVSLQVSLNGFGNDGRRYARSCSYGNG